MDVVYTEFFIVEKIKNRFFLIIALNSGKTLLVSIILIVAIRKIAVNPVRQLSGFFTKNDLFDPEATKQLDAISFSGPPDEINRLRDSVRDAVVKLQTERAENIEKQALLVTEQEKSIYAARMAELGIVAGGIAHEINNPLAIIKGLVDILKVRVRDNELSSVGKYLQKIDGALGRIAKIIQGMLQVARDGSQDPMEPAKLKDIFDTVKAVAGSGGRLADVKLEFIYPESNAYINCRRVQLEQVLINLVNNAADAVSDKNKVEKWVRIDSVRPNSGRIVIRVTDSGSGIPSEIVEKIFLPFFTSKAVGKGTGLGLSISTSIIEEHDGKLAYNSEHQNTQFIIDLPLKSA